MKKIRETFPAKIDARGRIQVPRDFLDAIAKKDPAYRERLFRVVLRAE
jgi:DNA-binding transcriptional regulator/RsmH inhibitor MraZ